MTHKFLSSVRVGGADGPPSTSARMVTLYAGGMSEILVVQLPPREYISRLEQALQVVRRFGGSVVRRFGMRKIESTLLTNPGAMHTSVGESRRAIKCHKQALRVAREAGNRKQEVLIRESGVSPEAEE